MDPGLQFNLHPKPYTPRHTNQVVWQKRSESCTSAAVLPADVACQKFSKVSVIVY
jgi:hypothetical protein